MVQQWLDKVLMEDAVRTSSHQTRMKNHGMEGATTVFYIPTAVKRAGMNEESFSTLQILFLVSGSYQTAAVGNQNSFPFFMPVPGYIANTKIVVIAGDGEDGSAVPEQLAVRPVDAGRTF